MVKTLMPQVRKVYVEYLRATWNLKKIPPFGRNVPVKVISKSRAVGMADKIVRDRTDKIWDAWQVAFWQDPDFVVDKIKAALTGLTLADDTDNVQPVDAKGNRLRIPEKYRRHLMLPAGFYLAQNSSKKSFQSGNTLAFYQPNNDTIYLIKEALPNSTQSELAKILLHELSHAYANRREPKATLNYSWRKLMDLFEVTEMSGSRLAEWFAFEVYGQWWGLHGDPKTTGPRITTRAYSHRPPTITMSDNLMGAMGGLGVDPSNVVEAYFNGSLKWSWPAPQDNLRMGSANQKWAWPTNWR
jgi:hypothetical protein